LLLRFPTFALEVHEFYPCLGAKDIDADTAANQSKLLPAQIVSWISPQLRSEPVVVRGWKDAEQRSHFSRLNPRAKFDKPHIDLGRPLGAARLPSKEPLGLSDAVLQ
jgi:hypothetical protein